MIGLIKAVSESIGVSPQTCRRIATSAHLRYKVFAIPKRRGDGVRIVAQPAKEVKAVQRALVEILSPQLPLHEAATAYMPGASIKKNALLHASARFITKLDFQDFFPSIDAPSIARHLRAFIPGISDPEITFLLGACLWKRFGSHGLCIGAPSSPMLSNSVMFRFDEAVAGHCAGLECVYSRYSDDITISAQAPGVLIQAEAFIRQLCRVSHHPTLRLNEDKRVAVGRGTAMRVTGLTLANQGAVTVGRARKRGVRAGAHRFVRGLLNADEAEALKGEIAFVLSVEPHFRLVLESSYGPRLGPMLPRVM